MKIGCIVRLFVLTEEQSAHEEIFLVFEGLDTYADIFLNGALLQRTDNMFVGYRIPVKRNLRKGENKLLVRFRSPIREVMPQWETNGFDYPAANDHYPQKLSVFTRKAPYSYGWDWGSGWLPVASGDLYIWNLPTRL